MVRHGHFTGALSLKSLLLKISVNLKGNAFNIVRVFCFVFVSQTHLGHHWDTR